MASASIIISVVIFVAVVLMLVVLSRSVRMIPQARARNVERLGRYRKTLEPGLNFVIPLVDRVKPLIDLREQVVSFAGQRVITEDNVVVAIDTVLFFQVTDPRAADYEIVNYIQAIEQLAATMLRSVIGSMDLEETLTSRDKINTLLRGVLDDASGKWGIRVTRVEIKAIDPPQTVKDRDPGGRGAPAGADPDRRGRQEGKHPARRGREAGSHLARGGPGAGDRHRLRCDPRRQSRSAAARLPVPAYPPRAGPGRWQHGVDDPERADECAEDAGGGLRPGQWP